MMEYFTFNDGNRYPALALGTVWIQGKEGLGTIQKALDLGYRAFDTSTNYYNEGMLGQAIRQSSLAREEIFVSAKLPGAAHQYDKAIKYLEESLFRMGLDYFDKYLIHWPLPMQDQYVEAWQALIDAQKDGLIKSIGVSNFQPDHLDKLIKETGVTPASNQIERHPYFNNLEVVEANRDRGIVTEAWSPFGRGILNDVLNNQRVVDMARKYDKQAAQVILNWNYQAGILSNPRADRKSHLRANLASFDFKLDPDDIKALNNLDQGEAGRVENQHPDIYEEYV